MVLGLSTFLIMPCSALSSPVQDATWCAVMTHCIVCRCLVTDVGVWLCQDDGHIFCLPHQLADEIRGTLDLVESVMGAFGFAQLEVCVVRSFMTTAAAVK